MPCVLRRALMLLAGTLLLVLSPSTARAAQTPPGPAILAPKAWQRLSAGPVQLRIRSGAVPVAEIRLNGRRITGHFPRPARGTWGRRSLMASASHGLRYGRNVLRVRFERRSGTWIQRTVRFHVDDDRPLAGAGHDVSVPAGTEVRLSARSSDLEPGPDGRARYRWRLVRDPSGWGWRGARTPEPTLERERTARPVVIPDVPGTYRFRLTTVAADGRVGHDTVTVEADPPPFVEVDTMAQEGALRGIRVGRQFVAATPGKWLQVAVFDRRTLEYRPGLSHEYDCPAATDNPFADDANEARVKGCIDRVRADMISDRLGEAHLVIAASQRDGQPFNTAPPVGAPQALSLIGTRAPDRPPGSPRLALQRGSFSAIGVPSIASSVAGTATQNVGDLRGSGVETGAIRGALIRNNLRRYVFESGERAEFDTQAPGSVSGQTGNGAGVNVIRLGARTFTAAPEFCCGYWHVVSADPRSLEGDSRVFYTDSADLLRMRDFLKAANDAGDRIVVVATRGRSATAVNLAEANPEGNRLVRQIADQIEDLGGTRTRLFNALAAPRWNGHSYTLVGRSHAGSARGIERQAGGQDAHGALNSSPLSGNLSRGRQWRWQVADAGEGGLEGDPGEKIAAAMHAESTPWPEQGDPAREAAVRFIGDEVGALGRNPRAQYYTRPYTFEGWEDIRRQVGDVGFAPGHGFSQADLAWAKGQLDQEIRWLETVYGQMGVYAAPFASSGLSTWAKLQAIASSVRNAVRPPDDGPEVTRQTVLTIFETIVTVGAAVPAGVGHAFHAVHALYDFYKGVVEVIAENGHSEGSAADEYEATTAELGTELGERLDAIRSFLTLQGPKILVADYGKLKLVGSCFSGRGCPDPLSQWQFTSEELEQAGQVFRQGAELHFYGVLLGARYTAWRLPESHREANNTDLEHYVTNTILDLRCPFRQAPSTGILRRPMELNITRGATPTSQRWEMHVLGFLEGPGVAFDPYRMNLPGIDAANGKVVTHRPLAPRDQGGLEAYGEGFFNRYFQRRPLEHYPFKDSPAGRWEDSIIRCED